ncbi:bifunctional aminoglycoside phosphotransferase/ATP-binding protein [Pollutimonas bauzanensis]|uniref:Aminoglycoside phosphotransferase domain-containing protein n=1 Tax=Pollutimonas bauzanensis TaxID=658167 RepID=A0A1M5MP27_9BURK|nr:bifunctional aminoglycoside phosphotransferase/ATP-binding protein [Pollutimonas bauzanensis]SHG78802.1 hypothetical protein SAMN04488135_101271 [Pollutimonas bauzanensis]
MPVQDQASTLAFLADPANYGEPASPVAIIETHISVVFLVGRRAYKLKRAVCLPYVDFSTAQRRLAACEKELELNRRTAAALYIAVHAIRRGADGRLAFADQGELVDAVVEMARFDEETLFDRMAARGQLTPALATELARGIARFHAGADIDHRRRGAANIMSVLDINEQSLAATRIFAPDDVARLNAALRAALRRHEALLDARAQAGKVRRCHGDLHLGNICLVNGAPTLFDCLEFNDALATIDVLYDLAFLVMDLWRCGRESIANLVLNRYLDERDEADGLPLMPFFMSLRAAVRAHVVAARAETAGEGDRAASIREARAFMGLALRLLEPAPARLVAIAGLSGTGKSTLAAALACRIGPAPGARILASDRIRKRIHGVSAETSLPQDAYAAQASEQVYAILAREARAILATGHAVIADAVFLRPEDRERIEQSALDAGVPFAGLRLEASPAELFTRVEARRGDISDANADVLRLQLARRQESDGWTRIQADDGIAAVVARASAALRCD